MAKYDAEKAREYYQKNRERIKARVAAYREANPDKARAAVLAWYARPENKAKRNEYFKTYSKTAPFTAAQARYRAKPEAKAKRQSYGKEWREKNPDKNCAKSNARRAMKMQRIPCWQSEDDLWLLDEIYELAALRSKLTGVPHDVDHVIPLKGRLVSGLHTPTNLQVIPASDNAKKGRKYLIS